MTLPPKTMRLAKNTHANFCFAILEIKKDALQEIAVMASKRKTGARGLRSIIENLLIDLMLGQSQSQ